MDTNKVIDDLVGGLKPTRPLRSMPARMAWWLAAAGAVVGVIVGIAGVRRDLELLLRSQRLVIDAGLVLLLAITTAWSALRMSVPGDERPLIHKGLPGALFIAWFLFTAGTVVSESLATGAGALVPDAHVVCAVFCIGGGLLSFFPMAWILRAAAPLGSPWIGAAAGLAASTGAMVGIELICVYERPAHMMAWHVLPVALFTAFGAWTAPRLLRAPPKK